MLLMNSVSSLAAPAQALSVALLQFNPVVGDLQGNARTLMDATRQAYAEGARLVVTPEMGNPGRNDCSVIPGLPRNPAAAPNRALDSGVRRNDGWGGVRRKDCIVIPSLTRNPGGTANQLLDSRPGSESGVTFFRGNSLPRTRSGDERGHP